jgi:23S rRNA (uracil1939-C5)-methyltransferase
MTHTVLRLGHLGDGIAEGPVYAPRVLPGEVIEGEVLGGQIAKPKIVTPSVDRVSAPCRHYKSCGGCALQHASDAFVSGWKADVVRQALKAQGLDAPIRHIATSPPSSRRRATLSGRRLKSGPVVGFHAPGSDALTAVPECKLLSPDLLAGLPALEALVAMLGSRKGEMRLYVTGSRSGLDCNATGGRALQAADFEVLADLARRHDLARLLVDGELVVERRPPLVAFDDIAVAPPSGAFLQATEQGEAALLGSVTEAVGNATKVVDLFAGCGTFSLPLARQADVHAVEGDMGLLTALDAGWRKATGMKNVTTETRDLFRRPLLTDEFKGVDAVVIDPPRAGAEAQTRVLAGASVPTIAFVSCNPTTFARDAKTLTDAGYKMEWIDVVDQFRWAKHVELVTCFRL